MSHHKKEINLISSSTILILSGVIIGVAFNQFIHDGLLPYLVAVGVSGILTYIIFDLAASRRALAILEAEREQVEGRLDKHMFSLTNYGFALPSTDEADQTELVKIEPETPENESADQLVASA